MRAEPLDSGSGSLIWKLKSKNKTEGHKETFEGDGYVYYLVYGDRHINVFTVQTPQIVYFNFMQIFLVHQLYLDKAGEKPY